VCHTVLTRETVTMSQFDIIIREVWVPIRYKRCTGNRVKPDMRVEGARRHISYGHAWNGIPFLQEWNTHSIWNGMVHFITAGMEWMLFILAGMEWAIPFLQEWNDKIPFLYRELIIFA
jgi:hypothetical protein